MSLCSLTTCCCSGSAVERAGGVATAVAALVPGRGDRVGSGRRLVLVVKIAVVSLHRLQSGLLDLHRDVEEA